MGFGNGNMGNCSFFFDGIDIISGIRGVFWDYVSGLCAVEGITIARPGKCFAVSGIRAYTGKNFPGECPQSRMHKYYGQINLCRSMVIRISEFGKVTRTGISHGLKSVHRITEFRKVTRTGISHGLTNSPPDCLLPRSARSAFRFPRA